jgi:desampylase
MGIRAQIARSTTAAILAHAASSRDEVCGLLLTKHDVTTEQGRGDVVVGDAIPCRNFHPTPATHFELDPAVLLATHRAARAGGPQVIGHYHSHPSGLPGPSATDAAHAAPDGALWLIVTERGITAWRAVRHGKLHDRFDPVELFVT